MHHSVHYDSTGMARRTHMARESFLGNPAQVLWVAWCMARNNLGETLTGNRGLDALSVVVVLVPGLAKLLLIGFGALDRTGATAERFAWWGIVASLLVVWFIL